MFPFLLPDILYSHYTQHAPIDQRHTAFCPWERFEFRRFHHLYLLSTLAIPGEEQRVFFVDDHRQQHVISLRQVRRHNTRGGTSLLWILT